jgi:hypothetical protein
MWMRDDNGGQAAEFLDATDGVIIDVGNAVPKYVASTGWVAAENGSLANGDFGDGVDAN